MTRRAVRNMLAVMNFNPPLPAGALDALAVRIISLPTLAEIENLLRQHHIVEPPAVADQANNILNAVIQAQTGTLPGVGPAAALQPQINIQMPPQQPTPIINPVVDPNALATGMVNGFSTLTNTLGQAMQGQQGNQGGNAAVQALGALAGQAMQGQQQLVNGILQHMQNPPQPLVQAPPVQQPPAQQQNQGSSSIGALIAIAMVALLLAVGFGAWGVVVGYGNRNVAKLEGMAGRERTTKESDEVATELSAKLDRIFRALREEAAGIKGADERHKHEIASLLRTIGTDLAADHGKIMANQNRIRRNLGYLSGLMAKARAEAGNHYKASAEDRTALLKGQEGLKKGHEDILKALVAARARGARSTSRAAVRSFVAR